LIFRWGIVITRDNFFEALSELGSIFKESGEKFKNLFDEGNELFTNGIVEMLFKKNNNYMTSFEKKSVCNDKKNDIKVENERNYSKILKTYDNLQKRLEKFRIFKNRVCEIIKSNCHRPVNYLVPLGKNNNYHNIKKKLHIIEEHIEKISETFGEIMPSCKEKKKTNIWFIDKEIRIREADDFYDDVEIFEGQSEIINEYIKIIKHNIKEINSLIDGEEDVLEELFSKIGIDNYDYKKTIIALSMINERFSNLSVKDKQYYSNVFELINIAVEQ